MSLYELLDGNEAGSSIAAKGFWGSQLDLSLEEETTTLIFNDRYFDIETLAGLSLDLSNLFISNADEGDFKVDTPYYRFGELDEFVSIENGKTYSIELTINLDEQIFEENGRMVLDTNFGLEVREL